MSAAYYVPIDRYTMEKTLIEDMGFSISKKFPNTGEFVYERDVTTKSGVEFPYKILVFSSIRTNSGWSDDCGKDAIRVVLMDKVTDFPVCGKQKRVNRTKNAMSSIKNRCRDLFKQVMSATKCPACDGIMYERRNRKTGELFLGCSRYAPSRGDTHCNVTIPV